MPRLINLFLVLAFATFFTIIAVDNIIDFNANWAFVQHVLSMDTTFKSSILMHRAIDNVTVQTWIYYLIIGTESITAVLCWVGLLFMLHSPHYLKGKVIAIYGLALGLCLYFFGFIIIANEWFAMWQSSTWNDHNKAFLFAIILMLGIICLSMPSLSDKAKHNT